MTGFEYITDILDKEKITQELYYDSKMEAYKNEAIDKFLAFTYRIDCEDFASCVSFAFVEQEKYAKRIFDKLNLNNLHAYAVLEDFYNFREELDQEIEERKQAQFY